MFSLSSSFFFLNVYFVILPVLTVLSNMMKYSPIQPDIIKYGFQLLIRIPTANKDSKY